jgi:hypothetical protein
MLRRGRAAVLIATGLLVASFTILPGTALAATIVPATNDATGATALANAMLADGSTLSAATFAANPGTGTPNGTSDALSVFPTNGTTFGILTSGDVNLADDANSSGSSGADLNGGNVRGDTDFDVTILKLDLTVPEAANCLLLDFAFYSDEFPEFVGSPFNDAFIAELDTSNWTTSGSTISAPNNFAFDGAGDVVSINSTGVGGMSLANAAGTTYDGATVLLQAATPASPGAHSLYLSLFDQGDQILDSAAFIDNIRLITVANVETDCVKGATPVEPPVKKTPSTILTKTPSATSVGYGGWVTYTYTEKNDGEVDLTNPSVVDDTCSPVAGVIGADLIHNVGDANTDGILSVGETWTFTCSMQLWADTTNTAIAHGLLSDGTDVTWCDPKSIDPKDPPKGVFCDQDEYAQAFVNVDKGCTPGYWKQDQHFDSWVGYLPNAQFSSVFDNAFPGKTLLQVLWLGGGGLDALGRHTVAALLNSTNSSVSGDYPFTTAQVISKFNAAWPGTKTAYNTLKDEFATANEMGCPLN